MSKHTPRPERVRDFRGGHYYRVHNVLHDHYLAGGHITASEFAVYSALCRRAADETANASTATLGTLAGVSERFVRSAIGKLEGLGLIRIVREIDAATGTRPNEYHLLLPPVLGVGSEFLPGGTETRKGRNCVPTPAEVSSPLNKKDVQEQTRRGVDLTEKEVEFARMVELSWGLKIGLELSADEIALLRQYGIGRAALRERGIA